MDTHTPRQRRAPFTDDAMMPDFHSVGPPGDEFAAPTMRTRLTPEDMDSDSSSGDEQDGGVTVEDLMDEGAEEDEQTEDEDVEMEDMDDISGRTDIGTGTNDNRTIADRLTLMEALNTDLEVDPQASSAQDAGPWMGYSAHDTQNFYETIHVNDMRAIGQGVTGSAFDFPAMNVPLFTGAVGIEHMSDDEYSSVNDYQNERDIVRWLETWRLYGPGGGPTSPKLATIGPEVDKVKDWELPKRVRRRDFKGDKRDMQGIDWTRLEITRAEARTARKAFYPQVSRRSSRPCPAAVDLPDTESIFRFKQLNTEHRTFLAHFQLRNCFSVTSRNDIFYAAGQRVLRTDAAGSPAETVIDGSHKPHDADAIWTHGFSITTLTSNDDILIAGGFNGEYAMTSLHSPQGTKPTEGLVTRNFNGITNHVQSFLSRNSGALQAAFCSNDKHLRILDVSTNRFTTDATYDEAINCSASSPDGRLRVVVGDMNETLIVNADTGAPLQRLYSHDDYAFACAWADDGIHVATGAQDSRVVVWDARWWGRPLRIVNSDLACPRSLKFSPVGSGRRVLMSAEADDVLQLIDARTFDRKQTVEFFGAVGGAGFTPDGQSVFVANCDKKFYGILEFERCDFDAYGAAIPEIQAVQHQQLGRNQHRHTELVRRYWIEQEIRKKEYARGVARRSMIPFSRESVDERERDMRLALESVRDDWEMDFTHPYFVSGGYADVDWRGEGVVEWDPRVVRVHGRGSGLGMGMGMGMGKRRGGGELCERLF